MRIGLRSSRATSDFLTRTRPCMEPRSYLRPAPCASEASASVRIAGSGSTRYDSVPRDPGTGTKPRSDAAAPYLFAEGPNAGAKALYVTDPDGYVIELYELPRSAASRK